MPPYRVHRRVPAEVEVELCRIWRDNLTVVGTVEEKFAWLYRDAPDRPDSVFLLETESGAPVGTAGVGIRRFAAGATPLRAGLLADLAVDKAHRSVGPALALVREVRTWALGQLDFAYGFPNKLAEGVFKRVGYQVLGVMPRYARVLRHADYASRVKEEHLTAAPAGLRPHLLRALQQPAVAALAGLAVDAAMLALGAAEGIGAASRLRLQWAHRPDLRFDELWASARGDYAVVGERSAKFLDWRFPPKEAISFALVTARDTSALRGYAVVEREGTTAHLRDLFGHKSDLPALLDLLIPALYARGAASVSMRYLGDAAVSDMLEARRFQSRQAERTIAIGVAERMSPELKARLLDVAQWHLTDADEDA